MIINYNLFTFLLQYKKKRRIGHESNIRTDAAGKETGQLISLCRRQGKDLRRLHPLHNGTRTSSGEDFRKRRIRRFYSGTTGSFLQGTDRRQQGEADWNAVSP